MNCEELLEQISARCDALRADLSAAAQNLREFNRRLEQIVQQLHKNIDVRDADFAAQFNEYCLSLRQKLDEGEPFWTGARTDIRSRKDAEWTGDLALPAKGLKIGRAHV